MAAPLTSSSSAPPKQLPLSYAERAKRAGSSTAAPPTRARPPTTNGNTRVGTQSTSPASSSRNITPSSSLVLTQPPTLPQPQQSDNAGVVVAEADAPASPASKNPPKPPPTNVWTARKELLAQQRVAATQVPISSHPRPQPPSQISIQSENPEPAPTMTQYTEKSNPPTNRPPLNGIINTTAQDSSPQPSSHVPAKNKIDDDPFVVRVPAHLQASTSANASSSSGNVPPSLDDSESWPEMGKASSSVSASGSVSGAASSIAEGDKKESITAAPRKSEC